MMLKAALGLALLALSYFVGVRTASFHAHLLFPLGFWLFFDALDSAHRGTSLLSQHSPAHTLGVILVGGLAGLLLDFHMIIVTGILRLLAVDNIITALEMYLGWGLCLPAIYESYQVFLNLGTRRNKQVSVEDAKHLIRPFWHHWGHPLLAKETIRQTGSILIGAGATLICIPLFLRMYQPGVSGWPIILSFAGFWLAAEGLAAHRNRSGILAFWLEGRWWPALAILPPALIFVIAWEGLNGLMGSWVYQNLFWLEPKVWNVPLVAIFGYIFWYILFLSFYEVLFGFAFTSRYRLRSSRRRSSAETE